VVVFTTLTGLVRNLSSLVAVRFLFGAGEAGAFPQHDQGDLRWMPTVEAGFSLRASSGCARGWRGPWAPGLVVFMISRMGCARASGSSGCWGLVWAVLFWSCSETRRARNRRERDGTPIIQPRPDPAARASPRSLDAPPTERKPLGDLLDVFGMAYGWYFYITWLPTYLKARGATMLFRPASYGGMPLFLGAIGLRSSAECSRTTS